MKILITLIIIVIAAAITFGLTSCASKARMRFDEAEWLERVRSTDIQALYAPNVKPDGRFFNPWMERPKMPFPFPMRSERSFDEFPEEKYAHVENDYGYLSDKNNSSISYIGHATFAIKLDGETIFTDPFLSDRAAISAKDVKIKFDYAKVPERPIVLITHNHYDHLDKQSVKALAKKSAVFIVPLRLGAYMKKLGAKEVHELGWWEHLTIMNVKYTLLPAQHWSMRPARGQGNSKTLWGGFLIEGSKTVYFSGDSGYFRGFEEFGNRFEIDYALIGAGSYDPRWFMHYIHTNVEEFFRAADDTKAKIAIPFHFGIISLSEEPLLYPLYEIDQHMNRHPEYKNRVLPLRVGEYLTF